MSGICRASSSSGESGRRPPDGDDPLVRQPHRGALERRAVGVLDRDAGRFDLPHDLVAGLATEQDAVDVGRPRGQERERCVLSGSDVTRARAGAMRVYVYSLTGVG